jgi:methionine aminopeptidase
MKCYYKDMQDLEKYKQVQQIAKRTIEHLKTFIVEGVSEKEVVEEAEMFMKDNGVDSFWYYDIGAFVLAGDRTVLSISGKDYIPSDTKVRGSDLITVDLSPQIDGNWGDYARSFIIGSNSELLEGIKAEENLHLKLKEFIIPNKSFEELSEEINKEIVKIGYKNLDFKGNLGHTIEKHKDNRKYIESGNNLKFSDVDLFTFEPHIQKEKGEFGFKMENIYYFEDNKLKEL